MAERPICSSTSSVCHLTVNAEEIPSSSFFKKLFCADFDGVTSVAKSQAVFIVRYIQQTLYALV